MYSFSTSSGLKYWLVLVYYAAKALLWTLCVATQVSMQRLQLKCHQILLLYKEIDLFQNGVKSPI